MKNFLVILLLAALAVLAGWWALGPGREPPSAAPGPNAAAPQRAPVDAESAEVDAAGDLEPAVAAVPDDAERRAVPEPEPAASWDPDLREELVIEVVDESGGPVPGAKVNLWALRTKNAHMLWRGDPSLGVTGVDGRLVLEFPVWAEPESRTMSVTAKVTHPHYATADLDLEIAPGVRRVALERGVLLSVSGWIGDASERLFDVTPHTSWGAELKREDWQTPPGRPPSTNRAPEATFELWISHRDDGGQTYFSAPVVVTPTAGQPLHEHLQLVATTTIRGTLDPTVPRPIENGEVEIAVSWGRLGDHIGIQRRAAVAADGTFEVAGLPAGVVQVIAACDGYRTPRGGDVPAGNRQRRGLTRDSAGEEADDPEEEAQRRPFFDNPAFDLREENVELVVPMVPDAVARVAVTGPDGDPVVGAAVHFWPNVVWGNASQIFLGREYSTKTDADGVATVVGLPGGQQGFVVEADGLAIPPRPGSDPPDRSASVQLRPGETTQVAVRLERFQR